MPLENLLTPGSDEIPGPRAWQHSTLLAEPLRSLIILRSPKIPRKRRIQEPPSLPASQRWQEVDVRFKIRLRTSRERYTHHPRSHHHPGSREIIVRTEKH